MQDLHIYILRTEGIPQPLIDDFTRDLGGLGVSCQSKTIGGGPFAGIEIFLPTAVAVYLAKPFFEAFLKKAGEDAYAAIKRKFGGLATQTAGIKIEVIVSDPKKAQRESPYSRVLSFHSESRAGARLKFLFPRVATEDEALALVDSMLLLLVEHHGAMPNDALTEILKCAKSSFLTVLHYDLDSRTWRVLAPRIE